VRDALGEGLHPDAHRGRGAPGAGRRTPGHRHRALPRRALRRAPGCDRPRRASFPGRPAPEGAGRGLSAVAASEALAAPLYVAWQITNECNLACLHCIEESGPGKAFPDELDRDAALHVVDELMANDVPYLSFSGGEPMLHPHFFEMVERVTSRGSQLKIETNGHYLTPANCARLGKLGVKAVQVSLDGATSATFGRMRVRGEFDRTIEGIRNLVAAQVPVEINFSPAAFNIHEAGRIVDLAFELGAVSFYSGRTMFTGNAVKAWRHLAVSEEQYSSYFRTLAAKRDEYRG